MNEISGWAGNSLKDISQANFWRTYEGFHRKLSRSLLIPSFEDSNELSAFQSGSVDCSIGLRPLETGRNFDLYITDGQHKVQFPSSYETHHFYQPKSVRTLSLRAIRALTKRVRDEIAFAKITSVNSLLQLTREVLEREISNRVRWRVVVKKTSYPTPAPAMIREHVLCFEIRTGNPPPFENHERRTGAVVVPVSFIQAPKVKHEQVYGRQGRRNTSMARSAGHRGASLDIGPQEAQSARRRHLAPGGRYIWSSLRLDQCSRPSWHPGRRQMVSDLHVDRRAGGVRNTTGAAMKQRRGPDDISN